MTTKLFSKKQTQQVVKDLRHAGYNVKRIPSGYACVFEKEVIFKAMIGSRGYLVRYNDRLLQEA